MKNTEFKLRKIEPDETQPKAIWIFDLKNNAVGIVYCDQMFVPVDGIELFPSDLKSILTIAENFRLFYNNL